DDAAAAQPEDSRRDSCRRGHQENDEEHARPRARTSAAGVTGADSLRGGVFLRSGHEMGAPGRPGSCPGQGLRGAVTDSATSGPMEQPADRHAEHRERKRRPRMPMHGAALRKPEMSGGRPTKKKPRRRRKK